jgi:hypothetical protein
MSPTKSERSTLHPSLSVKTGALYGNYKAWAIERGDKPMTSTMFGRRVTKLEGVTKRKSGTAVYEGIGVQADRNDGGE